MSVVFAFLILLVLFMSLAARILRRFPEDEAKAEPTPSPSSAVLVAAAVAAARRARDQSS